MIKLGFLKPGRKSVTESRRNQNQTVALFKPFFWNGVSPVYSWGLFLSSCVDLYNVYERAQYKNLEATRRSSKIKIMLSLLVSVSARTNEIIVNNLASVKFQNVVQYIQYVFLFLIVKKAPTNGP